MYSSIMLPLTRRIIFGVCLSFVFLQCGVYAADYVDFNTDILDVNDKKNIDFSRFESSGYIMPGDYSFKLKINQNEIDEQPISVYNKDDDKKETEACFSSELVKQFGLKEEFLQKISMWHQGQCADITSLEGVIVSPDMGAGVLNISIPQVYLEYVSNDWVPISMWDEGIPGLLTDYNLNFQSNTQESDGRTDRTLSGNGTSGLNIGAWRARADWQTNYASGSSGNSGRKKWAWDRSYVYRAMPKLGAKLTLGEDYMNSDLFDSFRFVGASMISDDNMLPPNLRGYAPEVSGVAKTNAKVTISQQGRIIYETQVAAGPFSIQDLNSAVSGTLDVRVQEQDGSVQQYKVSTASIPYLTRPGSIRFKVFSGRPTNESHQAAGETFSSGEMSWGINNGWSLYGGSTVSDSYRSLAVGVGRDLMMLGALSFDVTRADARLNNYQSEDKIGRSYRLSYSKRFDDTGSEITFAGYRFAEKDFMSFSDFLNYVSTTDAFQEDKEMYTVTFSQQFVDSGTSLYVNYSHQTYWNSPEEDRYNLSLSRFFDMDKWKNINISLTAYRNKFEGNNDDGAYISASIPWGDTATVSYNSTFSDSSNSHRIGYYDRLENGDNYQIATGSGNEGMNVSGYYDHSGDLSDVTANLDYEQNQYRSAGLTLRGGVTATAKGAALHRVNSLGATRVLVDTVDAANVPVHGYGDTVLTNHFGKAVITDVTQYIKNNLSIDIDNMPDDAEATYSVASATLTEGAIGYRKFNVISGMKALAVIRLVDGSFPPFGASVHTDGNQEVGIVGGDGQVYLSGLNPGASLQVVWSEDDSCKVVIPEKLGQLDLTDTLLLPCIH